MKQQLFITLIATNLTGIMMAAYANNQHPNNQSHPQPIPSSNQQAQYTPNNPRPLQVSNQRECWIRVF